MSKETKQAPKHLMNDPNTIVVESLRGLCYSNAHLRLLEKEKVIYRADLENIIENQVTIVCGGGAGHEPSHAGLVGPGLLSAAVSGQVFASPSTKQINAALRKCRSPHGTLLVVKNYTGDRLHFGLAAERARAEGARVETVVVAEDVAVGREKGGLVGRRGLAGTVLVHKVAGALASRGAALEEVHRIAKWVAENIATMGVALEKCHVPGSSTEEKLGAGNIELGMGIHGEPGMLTTKLIPIRDLARRMLDTILSTDPDRNFLPMQRGEECCLLVNNLGGTSNLELGVAVKEAVEYLNELGMAPLRVFSGTYMTSLGMPGVSFTLLRLPRESNPDKNLVLSLLDDPAAAPGWINPVTFPSVKGAGADWQGKEELAGASNNTFNSVPVDPELFSAALRSGCTSLIDAEPEITRYDSVAGDGDCGITLRNGAKVVLDALDSGKLPITDAAGTLMFISDLLEESMGGTSGALYCIFLNSLASNLRNFSSDANDTKRVDNEVWTKAIKGALDGLGAYTPARKGDRTLMDALIPFVEALQEGGLERAVLAAESGAKATQKMSARFGRASYVGEGRENAVPDAGACGVACLLRGISRTLSNQ
ncbi:uncharacterized protein VTP21DRAFT_4244 [Calcarisporiella thermophila]|uniref:uncharacterized protein n=1 Tax=Calcarisporiella thermophila TaxID=911321 RepID=UPI003743BBCA